MFIQEIISAEDILNKYDSFWVIWECLYPKLKELNEFAGYGFNEIIKSYLLAVPWWKKSAKEWRSLKSGNEAFFSRCVLDMGHNSVVLDAFAQFLNEIGSSFINSGLQWIVDLILKIEGQENVKLGVNTIYHLEIFVRRYVYLNRSKTKADQKINHKLVTILNFLISHGSVSAYMLREDIL
ncbi:hypothetical protein [uncultured Roseivirga sp.]|uniref:hypothetical protein n=1 Tax=uncultured Roseivirga sp. TaxID=543088 RepID=UPI000D7A30BA|nr:hypothetical protein [uncultured Roseivirga sp.]PWL31746.1 MAG: hypothetical protein DCO95_00750 [Roseivirga sp. XM-24bin3]